jgi:uncharacterized protein (DUF983 family)
MPEHQWPATTLLTVTLRLVCPACLRGPLFRKRYELHENCVACGQDLVGKDGAQYGGPMVLGYTLGGAAGLLTTLVLLLLLGPSAWAVWAGLFVTIATVFLTFRNCKAAWTWLLYRTGQLPESGSNSPEC